MVRSKSTRSPVTLKATLRRGTPVGKTSAESKQLTPEKLTAKRPLHFGSESEENEDQTVEGFASDDDEFSDDDNNDSEESDDSEGNIGDGDEGADVGEDDDDSVVKDDGEEDGDNEPECSSLLQPLAVAEVKTSQSLSTLPDSKNVMTQLYKQSNRRRR
ncbi:hypothetical protein EG68_00906 [Paragonimus skrjabini miyazakii]|uniref:Uncharacterized protein n=1 Tax=Paragonimus skrjabini miyazakii TaxID=59628 RepID=A0A8S9Z7Z2_9TREM|nr:hypothetical protein EG68_00906 [Paragonimus skrjabini miyazakii]